MPLNKSLIVGIGTGLLVGSGVTILYFRLHKLSRQVENLSTAIAQLTTQIAVLAERISSLRSFEQRKKRKVFFSASSGDEDEIYEDANLSFVSSESNSKNSVHEGGFSDPQAFFSKIEKLFEGGEQSQEEAFRLMSRNAPQYSANCGFHWRMSKACYLVSKIEKSRGNSDKAKDLLQQSVDHASASLQLDDQCSSAHRWYAISLGNFGDYLSSQDKIKNGFAIKDHIQRAIDLKPSDPFNHHMMGRWSYSVYMLSWVERKLAATLIAAPPEAKIEDALESFLTAEKLRPNIWKENMLFIAKCYIELKVWDEVSKWLEAAAAVPVKTKDEEEAQQEIEQLLPKYQTS